MARSRNIKPGFFLNDRLAECEPLARLLFAGLWCIADREGRLEDRPKRIKAEVLPYDDCDVDELLNQLAEREFIIRYEVDGEKYIQVTNFSKHQNPHKNEKDSEIPAPDMYHTSTVQVPDEHRTMPDKDNVRGEGQEIANAEKPNNHGCLTEYSTSTVQVPEKHSTNPADSFNMIPDSLNMIDEGPAEPELTPSPSLQERECLKILKRVKNYPFDYKKDLEHLRSLAVDFPNVDMLNELKKWEAYKLDHPLKKSSNPRLQIRNWFENAQRWSKDERASPDEEKYADIYLT